MLVYDAFFENRLLGVVEASTQRLLVGQTVGKDRAVI